MACGRCFHESPLRALRLCRGDPTSRSAAQATSHQRWLSGREQECNSRQRSSTSSSTRTCSAAATHRERSAAATAAVPRSAAAAAAAAAATARNAGMAALRTSTANERQYCSAHRRECCPPASLSFASSWRRAHPAARPLYCVHILFLQTQKEEVLPQGSPLARSKVTPGHRAPPRAPGPAANRLL